MEIVCGTDHEVPSSVEKEIATLSNAAELSRGNHWNAAISRPLESRASEATPPPVRNNRAGLNALPSADRDTIKSLFHGLNNPGWAATDKIIRARIDSPA